MSLLIIIRFLVDIRLDIKPFVMLSSKMRIKSLKLSKNDLNNIILSILPSNKFNRI